MLLFLSCFIDMSLIVLIELILILMSTKEMRMESLSCKWKYVFFSYSTGCFWLLFTFFPPVFCRSITSFVEIILGGIERKIRPTTDLLAEPCFVLTGIQKKSVQSHELSKIKPALNLNSENKSLLGSLCWFHLEFHCGGCCTW